MKFFLLILLLIVNTSISALNCSTIKIIQKPILFSAERIQLTRDYRLHHYGINSKSIMITPQMIVLHWTALSNFKAAFSAFYPEKFLKDLS